MRLETTNFGTTSAQAVPPAPHVPAEVAAVADARLAPFPTAVAGPDRTAPASELDTLKDELRTSLRTAGAELPELVIGPVYGVTKDGFMVPLEEAVRRATAFGHKNVRDFVIGEIAVQLGRSRLGYDRTDARIRDNTPLRLIVELVETASAARAMSTRYPGLTDAINNHVTTIWSNMAERAKQNGAPESIRTFMLCCLSRALRNDRQNVALADEQLTRVVESAIDLFEHLTAPPSPTEHDDLVRNRGEADKIAAARVDLARTELFPHFEALLKSALPNETPAAKADQPRSLISAEEAIARNQQRMAQRQNAAQDSEAADKVAAADAERLLVAIERHDLAGRWNLRDRPTPMEIAKAIDALVARGAMKEPQHLDRTIELTLRALGKVIRSDLQPFATERERGSDTPPWSLSYLRAPAGPDFAALLSEKVQRRDARMIEEPRKQRGGLGRLLENNARTSEARDWVTTNQAKSETLRTIDKLASGLAKFDGVTAELARQLQVLHRETQAALDTCRSCADELDKTYTFRIASTFAEKRADFEGLFEKIEGILELLRSSVAEGGVVKGFVRSLIGTQATVDAQSVVSGSEKLVQSQMAARRYVTGLMVDYPNETDVLAKLLEPRFDWFRTSVLEAKRQTDPLLPFFDRGWLGVVAAELRRAELNADRIARYVSQLPPQLQERAMIEMGSAESLKGAFIADASDRLATRLSGQARLRNGVGFDVAAVQSYGLPVLAARPRLHFLATEHDLVEAPLNDRLEVERLGELSFPSPSQQKYSSSSEETKQAEGSQAALGAYNFWCRTFDLAAPTGSFLSELVGWRAYYAGALEDVIDQIGSEPAAGDVGRIVGDALDLANGAHPIADASNAELDKCQRAVEAIAKRLTTSERALKELGAYLDASRQPVNVLLHAINDLPKARDRNAAAALISPWLKLNDSRLREAARTTLAQLSRVSEIDVLRGQLEKSDASGARLLALHDMISLVEHTEAVDALLEAASDADPAVSAFATYCLSEAAKTTPHTTAIADYMIDRLKDKDSYAVHFACVAFRAMAAAGSSYAAEKVIAWATEKVVADPRIAELLQHIGASPVDNSVAGAARSAAALVEANVKKSGAKLPRRVSIKTASKAKAQARKSRDLADCVLSAARALGDARTLDAVSDRMKVALRLRTKFEQWSGTLPPEVRPALQKLDLPDAIVDDAVAELSAGNPRGYLANTPELVSAMLSSNAFSAAETAILEHGRIPDELVELASHPFALDGSWREKDIASTFADPARCKALIQLKLRLSSDLPNLVAEIIASILDQGTPRAIAGIAYDALTHVLDCEIPLLDPKLDAEQRKQALANPQPIDPAIDQLLERAVVERLGVVDAGSDEAAALVQYLAGGEPARAERRLSDAVERATTEPQVQLLLQAARPLSRRRPSDTDAKVPWLMAVLRASPRATIEQVITVRDARSAATQASDRASAALAGDRVATLAAAVLDKHESLPADQLAPLLAILADSEDDTSRQAKLAGLREIMTNTDVPWTAERMRALRNGLMVVQANHRFGALERSLEQAIRFAGRLLDACRDLPEADFGKHFEILVRCNDMTAKTQYADNVVKMYRMAATNGGRLSPVFIEQLGLWIAAADAGSSALTDQERKRELILSSLVELSPLDDATMTQLVRSCAAMSLQRTAEVLRDCKQHSRDDQLTADDVKRIANKGDDTGESASFFEKILGSRVSLTRWTPSARSLGDPLKEAWNDTLEIKDAKRAMRRSMGDFFDLLGAARGQTADVEQVAISSDVGTFAFGAWSRSAAPSRPAAPTTPSAPSDGGTVLSSNDYAAHKANSDRVAAAARARILDGKHPVEKASMLMMPNSTAIARAFDGFYTKTVETVWESAASGPRLNINRYILSEIQRDAAIKAAEEAEARGETVNLVVPNVDICERPIETETKTKQVRLLVNLMIDTSLSTKSETEDRLAYFKQLAVMLLNAFSAVEKIELSSSLISFADFGTLLMEPARQHDIKTMCQALGPLESKGGTNMADALAKGHLASSKGTYDKVIHVVITDGQPNRLGDTQATVAALRAQGHVVVGFGVGPDALHLGNVFGQDHAISESNPDLIAGRVYNYLKEVVARAAR